MQLTTDIHCFLKGQKPGLLFSDQYARPYYDKNSLRHMKHYPYIQKVFRDTEFRLYFQNNLFKQQFLLQSKSLEVLQGHEFTHYLGLALGFSPCIVKNYVDNYLNEPNLCAKTKIGYDYSGLQFVGDADHFVSDVEWLWSRYPMKQMVIYYNHRWSFLYKNDYERLHKITEEIENENRFNKMINALDEESI